MKVVLVFSTATGNIFTEMMDGVRDFAQDAGWNIQSIKFDGSPFPIRELIKFWSPIGCIVDASGNGLRKDSIPYRAFGQTPVVYIGGDSLVVPPNATCVVHDAHATSETAARELLAMGFDHFAFLGIKGRNWSLLRKDAFANAMRLNGRPFDAFDLSPGGKDNDAVKRWLANLPKPCGVFAANDIVAETALAVCRLADISVPEDIAVIGVDDNEEICENTLPTLTSIHPDFRQGGRFAARLLARKLLGNSKTLPKTEFAVSGITRRGSTRRFKRKDSCVAEALERIWKPLRRTPDRQGHCRRFPLFAKKRRDSFPAGDRTLYPRGTCPSAHPYRTATSHRYETAGFRRRRTLRLQIHCPLSRHLPQGYRPQPARMAQLAQIASAFHLVAVEEECADRWRCSSW